MSHVVLLGDSIFDNDRYVPGGPSVIEHLRRCLSGSWRATLLARDGSIAADVEQQLGRLPEDATHLVISVGGNNALDHCSMVRHDPASSFAEVLERLGDIRAEFRVEYRAMLHLVRATGRAVVGCTIYDTIPDLHPAERTALALFNEIILGELARVALPIIDLRLICTSSADYARISPIEPSVVGGGKIARAVARVVQDHEFSDGDCRVYI